MDIDVLTEVANTLDKDTGSIIKSYLLILPNLKNFIEKWLFVESYFHQMVKKVDIKMYKEMVYFELEDWADSIYLNFAGSSRYINLGDRSRKLFGMESWEIIHLYKYRSELNNELLRNAHPLNISNINGKCENEMIEAFLKDYKINGNKLTEDVKDCFPTFPIDRWMKLIH